MIYLKSFEIPKDRWVDEYFTRSGYEKLPDNMPMASNNTHLNTWYPWNNFYLRGLYNFEFNTGRKDLRPRFKPNKNGTVV